VVRDQNKRILVLADTHARVRPKATGFTGRNSDGSLAELQVAQRARGLNGGVIRARAKVRLCRVSPRPCYHPAEGPNDTHVWSSPAVEEGTRRRKEGGTAHRRGTCGLGQHQRERSVTPSCNVCFRSEENQSGAEGAMGKAEDCQAKADDLGGGPQADRGGTASEMGQGKARRLKEAEPNRGGKMPAPLPDIYLFGSSHRCRANLLAK